MLSDQRPGRRVSAYRILPKAHWIIEGSEAFFSRNMRENACSLVGRLIGFDHSPLGDAKKVSQGLIWEMSDNFLCPLPNLRLVCGFLIPSLVQWEDLSRGWKRSGPLVRIDSRAEPFGTRPKAPMVKCRPDRIESAPVALARWPAFRRALPNRKDGPGRDRRPAPRADPVPPAGPRSRETGTGRLGPQTTISASHQEREYRSCKSSPSLPGNGHPSEPASDSGRLSPYLALFAEGPVNLVRTGGALQQADAVSENQSHH